MRYLSRALLAGGLGFAVAFIAGCGGGAGLLSGNQASGLNNQLNQVSSALADGNCSAVQNGARAFASSVANLPDTVSTTLRTDLDQGASTIAQVAVAQCRRAGTTTRPATTPTTTTTATTPTTKTVTTPTTTATTPTTPATTTTTTATTPTTPGTTSTGTSGGGGLSGGSGSGGSGGGGGLGGANNGNG